MLGIYYLILLVLCVVVALIAHSANRNYWRASLRASLSANMLWIFLSSNMMSHHHWPLEILLVFFFHVVVSFPIVMIVGLPFVLIRRAIRKKKKDKTAGPDLEL